MPAITSSHGRCGKGSSSMAEYDEAQRLLFAAYRDLRALQGMTDASVGPVDWRQHHPSSTTFTPIPYSLAISFISSCPEKRQRIR